MGTMHPAEVQQVQRQLLSRQLENYSTFLYAQTIRAPLVKTMHMRMAQMAVGLAHEAFARATRFSSRAAEWSAKAKQAASLVLSLALTARSFRSLMSESFERPLSEYEYEQALLRNAGPLDSEYKQRLEKQSQGWLAEYYAADSYACASRMCGDAAEAAGRAIDSAARVFSAAQAARARAARAAAPARTIVDDRPEASSSSSSSLFSPSSSSNVRGTKRQRPETANTAISSS